MSADERKLLRKNIDAIFKKRSEVTLLQSGGGCSGETVNVDPLWENDDVVTPTDSELKADIKDYIWTTANIRRNFTNLDIAGTVPNLQEKQVEQFLDAEHTKYKESVLALFSKGISPESIASAMPGVPLSTIRRYLDEPALEQGN